ncbi:hypothetical protein B296_00006179 [Ensete ventricosum]|uniref:Uncharacterized protein n=1 Tax=Ensete ventricosum TaxID=4639 RepID=A0A427AN91_ENSVE|nr:hypothetical protein B296_00006179 [Ensete ventricosum]
MTNLVSLFTCFRSHLSTELIPRMRKDNSSIANFSMGKGRNTVGGTEGNLASNLVISLMTDKPVLNPSLKMKTLKCLIYDIDVLICRISLVISPGSDTEMVHIRFCEGLLLIGWSLLQLCNMLKKKHDEAKEVLVRAVVNNNKLLMLNHPMIEEKISFVLVLRYASMFSWTLFLDRHTFLCSSLKGPLVFSPYLFLLFRCEVILDIEGLANLLWSFALYHVSHSLAGQV